MTVKHAFNVGMGGKGIVPGRPDDTFGIGWSRVTFSDDLLPLLRQRLDLGLDPRGAIEMYYNAAITRSLGVEPVISRYRARARENAQLDLARLEDVNTAVVGAPPTCASKHRACFRQWHLDFNWIFEFGTRKAVCGQTQSWLLQHRAGWLAVELNLQSWRPPRSTPIQVRRDILNRSLSAWRRWARRTRACRRDPAWVAASERSFGHRRLPTPAWEIYRAGIAPIPRPRSLSHVGKDLRGIQELLRHKNIRTTVRYTPRRLRTDTEHRARRSVNFGLK